MNNNKQTASLPVSPPENQVVIYESDGGVPKISVTFQNETVWLSQAQLVELFQSSKANVSEHIKNIFSEGELSTKTTVRKFRTVQSEGGRDVTRDIECYNLDMIISLGYRVKSSIATKFRIWATERLREYMIKGFTMDDERLKEAGAGNYWKELLDRIRDIRSSEKVLYRQVLDLYATSIDYDAKSDQAKKFFTIVQNKLHYAAHGKTAAEIILERADASTDFMGLLSVGKNGIHKADVTVAKNYLSETELKRLNNIVSAYFDIAELRAIDQKPTHMQDYIDQLDKLVASMDRHILQDAGKVGKIEAEAKAHGEYKKYQVKTLSSVEETYVKTIRELKKKVENEI